MPSIFTLEGSQKGEKEKEPEKIFEEIIAENFPTMRKQIVNPIQEAQRVPGRITQGGTHQDTQ